MAYTLGLRIGLSLLFLGLVCELSPAVAAEEVVYEVVDSDGIYYGEGKSPKSPGVMKADDVWAEIPEYKEIIEEELTEDDPKYHLLLKKATERFNKAMRKLAKRDAYDMLGEVGSIAVKGDASKKITEVTKEMIKLVTRD